MVVNQEFKGNTTVEAVILARQPPGNGMEDFSLA
jgi:hypothetical protein